MAKLSGTTLGGIALAVLVANLFGAGHSSFVFYFADAPDGVPPFDLVEVQDDAAWDAGCRRVPRRGGAKSAPPAESSL